FLLAAVGVVRLFPLTAQGTKTAGAKAPFWIWFGDKAQDDQSVYFRKEISLNYRVVSARLYGTCDNQMTVYINGNEIVSSSDWETPVFREITDSFINPTKVNDPVRNVIAVKAHNQEGPAGLLLKLVIETAKKEIINVVTDTSWRASDRAA